LEIAYLSNLGIELESSQLPIPSIVARFGEVFGFDPLRMISSGTLAVTVPTERVKDVRKVLEDLRTPFAFVGQVIEGVGVRLLRDDTTLHYTEIRCEEDELARLWSLYPRKG
jgi:hydrogenase expression/formation protein HypE